MRTQLFLFFLFLYICGRNIGKLKSKNAIIKGNYKRKRRNNQNAEMENLLYTHGGSNAYQAPTCSLRNQPLHQWVMSPVKGEGHLKNKPLKPIDGTN